MSAAVAGIVRVLLLPAAPAALLGAPPRIYPMAAPQDTARPYIVYGRVSGHPEYHLRGEGGLGRNLLEIEAWTTRYSDLLAIDNLLRLTLSGFRGPVLVDGVTHYVRRMHFENESEDTVSPMTGSGSPLYHLTKELACDAAQSIPSR